MAWPTIPTNAHAIIGSKINGIMELWHALDFGKVPEMMYFGTYDG